MTADTTPGTDSLVYTVDDPGGTPLDRKSTIGQVLSSGASLSAIGDLEDAPTAFTSTDTTPDVSAGSVFITANASATTITDFDTDISNGKMIWIIVNDANTTFDMTSSGLEGVGNVDYAATNGDLVNCIYTTTDDQWHCNFWPSVITTSVINGVPTVLSEINSDQLSDTSTPHGLLAAEVSGTILNNYDGTPEAKEYDLPAAAEGYNFVLCLGVAQNVTIDPNGTEIIYLNGTALAAGNSVTNAAPTIGECISCWTIQTGASAFGWVCKSSDADFADLGS